MPTNTGDCENRDEGYYDQLDQADLATRKCETKTCRTIKLADIIWVLHSSIEPYYCHNYSKDIVLPHIIKFHKLKMKVRAHGSPIMQICGEEVEGSEGHRGEQFGAEYKSVHPRPGAVPQW